MKKSAMVLPALALAGGLTIGGVGLASADTVSTSTSTTSSSSATQPPTGDNPQAKDGGVITTDSSVVSSVTSAVTAKYSGATIDRVAKLPDGSYLAFTRTSDDVKVIVSLSSEFAITSEKQVPATRPADAPASTTNQ